jgi:hypothetical protein
MGTPGKVNFGGNGPLATIQYDSTNTLSAGDISITSSSPNAPSRFLVPNEN